MNITQLQYFQAVCKFGSTVKAAEAMFVSQPSVSNAISKLEEEYDLSLFTRRNNRLVLTDDGKFFLTWVEKILGCVEEFNTEIHRLSAKDEIHLSIPPVGDLEVSRSVYAYREAHPDLQIKVYEDAQNEAIFELARGRRDFIITILDDVSIDTQDELEAIPLGYVDLKFCVSKESPLAQLDQIEVKQIGNFPLVMMKDYYFQNLLLSNQFRKLGIEPNIVLYAGLFTTLRKYVQMNYAAGFAFGSTSAESDFIRYIPLIPRVTATFGIAYRKSALANRNVKQMMDYMEKAIKL